jgi:hypothetical protein
MQAVSRSVKKLCWTNIIRYLDDLYILNVLVLTSEPFSVPELKDYVTRLQSA